ncbi:MAG: helix-turn-helix domain-containing protein [Bacteroidota bacterium]
MSYLKEDEYSDQIDCYWSSSKRDLYPSIPEPYINVFFPVDSDIPAFIKGISSQSDYLDVKSDLFGVRLLLKGFYQLNLASCHEIVNLIQSFVDIGGRNEIDLILALKKAGDFESRVETFRDYYRAKIEGYTLSKRQLDTTRAFNFFVFNFSQESIVENCASFLKVSPRTAHRWFTNEIGINPKKLCRIVRFHRGVHHLLSGDSTAFYDLGYFDQAHYIKEFIEFTGRSPEEFFKFLSEKYNT